MSIEKRLERVEAILDARGLDWDHPRVEEDHFVGAGKMVVEEPPKKWRRLADEFVQPGDWMNAKVNRQDVDPPDGGWIPADPCYFGRRACTLSMYFARPVVDEPAKEASLDGLPDIRTFAQPNLRWRILEPGEVVQEGDRVKAKTNPPSDPPNGLGWLPVDVSVGASVCEDDPYFWARPVSDEPAKEPEPEHPAGPRPDPGKGYRILSKDPPEELHVGDEHELSKGEWVESVNARTHRKQGSRIWYRRKIEVAKPAWEPKVGDWVRVTRPENWREWKDPLWREEMHIYDGKVFEFVKWSQWSTGQRAILQGIDWFFHRDWLSPAEPPAKEKPAEPEYRQPVLPADCGKQCEFSDDGKTWITLELNAWLPASKWVSKDEGCWQHARIKKDA